MSSAGALLRWAIPLMVGLGLAMPPLTPAASEAQVAPKNLDSFTGITAVGPNQLEVYRYGAESDDTPPDAICEVTMGKGLVVPAASAPPAITGCHDGGTSTVVSGLAPDTLYTFATRTRYGDGSISDPDIRRAMTRRVGSYVADRSRPGFGWRTSALPASAGDDAALVVAPSGAVSVAFRRATAEGSGIYFTSRRCSASGWSTPVRLGEGSGIFLSRAPTGQLAVGWTKPLPSSPTLPTSAVPQYRVRPAGSATWRATRSLAAGSSLVSFVQDTRGHLHTLTTGIDLPLTYRTNATGQWTAQALPRRSRFSGLNGRLAVDPATGRIVLAFTDDSHGATTLKMASKPPSTATFTAFYRRLYETMLAPSPTALTGLAANGSRITVGLRRDTGSADGGLYLMTGTAASNVQGLTRIRGTGPRDARLPWTGDPGPLVSSVTPTRVVITFTRTSPTWTPGRQGLFVVNRFYSSTTHRWTFSPRAQRTTSPYDRAIGAARDAGTHLYLGYVRTWYDLDSLGGP